VVLHCFSFLVFRLTYCACIRLLAALLHYLRTLTSLKLSLYIVLILLLLDALTSVSSSKLVTFTYLRF